MAHLRDLKEALDQGECIMPRRPRAWDEDNSLEDEHLASIHKTGQVYIYDSVVGAIELFADFDELVEAVEGSRRNGHELVAEMFGMPFDYEPLEWDTLTMSPDEDAELERKWKMDRYLGKAPPPPSPEEFEAERERFAHMGYREMRAFYIDMFERLALEKPVSATYYHEQLAAFCAKNKER